MFQREDILGVFWGTFTGLGALALSYMASDLSRMPFVPAVFFGLPAGSQPNLTTIIWSAGTCLLCGALFGFYLVKVKMHPGGRVYPASMLGAGVFFMLFALIDLIARSGRLLTLGFLIWQAVLLLCWGWILARLIGEVDQHATPVTSINNESRRMTPQQFRFLVIAGVLTAILSALRILWMRSGI